MSDGMSKVDMQVALEQAMLLLGGSTKSGARGDSWTNFASGIGTADDKSEYNAFTGGYATPIAIFESMYRKDGIARTIVKAPAKDATKNWVKISDDTDNKLLDTLKHLKAKKAFTQLAIHARKFGGGAILIQTKNADKLEKPLDINGITEIVGLKNFNRGEFEIIEGDLNQDPTSSMYEEIEIFKIRKRLGGVFPVHHSRLIIMKGEKYDRVNEGAGSIHNTIEEEFWGGGVLEPIMEALGYYGTGMKAIATMMQESTVGKFIMAGLKDLLADMGDSDSEASTEAWSKFQARIKAMVLTKSVIQSILLDAESGEDFKREQINFSGIPDIMALNQMQIAGMSEIPITKLFGRSPAGENSTGESDAKNYNDFTIGVQEDLEPGVQYLIDLITKGKSRHQVSFNHPDMPSEKELLEMKKIQAEIDKMYTLDIAALFADEVRKSRFGGESYSFDTVLQQEEAPEAEEVEETTAEELEQDVADYMKAMDGINQQKLDEKIDGIIADLKAKGFDNYDKNLQYEVLQNCGYFNPEQLKRMTGK